MAINYCDKCGGLMNHTTTGVQCAFCGHTVMDSDRTIQTSGDTSED